MPVSPVAGAGVAPVTPVTPSARAGAAEGTSFAKGLEAVQRAEGDANRLATQMTTGGLGDIHDFMAASSKAQLAVELTVALRNRAVEAYQEIMRMQV